MQRSFRVSAYLLGLMVVMAVAPGCADSFGWDSFSWWNSKAKKAKEADLARFGPTADQRVAEMKKLEKSPPATPEQRQQKAMEIGRQLQTEKDTLVRMSMMRALGAMPCDLSTRLLQAGLKDREADVRMACCRSLAKQNNSDAAAALASAAAGDTDIDVRLAAVRAIGNQKDPTLVKRTMAVALEDPDPAMQHCAMAALKTSSGRDFGNDVNKAREYVRSDLPAGAQNEAIAGRPTSRQ